ncbi:MAG: phosphatidylserine decarboxylase family protein [Bacteroidetes bacterium]|nr:phosphatidylserine decarboxylase family protein [Bacteroidota bacterium]
MRLHREGTKVLFISLVLLGLLNAGFYWYIPWPGLIFTLHLASLILYGFILNFFRHPVRIAVSNENLVYSPADGKVVVIEETVEKEYFNDQRIQVSIFMSPLNVHCNRFPVGGVIKYKKYHPGKYLVAWHPKSSTENERSTLVLRQENGREILVRQIAGAVARRIIPYGREGERINQGEELGFIRFGSRVDIFLPLNAKIKTQINQKVKANIDVIAEF